MSEEDEKKSGRKRETERSLRPHNVCFLFVSSVQHILRLEKDSIVQASNEGFLSGAVEGQLVAKPRCAAPQEDNLSRSLF